MKSAKEMFEELGYELKEETKKYLRYKKGVSKYDDGMWIAFDLSGKRIRLYTKTPQYNNNPRYADYKELQVINKQVEELGWKVEE